MKFLGFQPRCGGAGRTCLGPPGPILFSSSPQVRPTAQGCGFPSARVQTPFTTPTSSCPLAPFRPGVLNPQPSVSTFSSTGPGKRPTWVRKWAAGHLDGDFWGPRYPNCCLNQGLVSNEHILLATHVCHPVRRGMARGGTEQGPLMSGVQGRGLSCPRSEDGMKSSPAPPARLSAWFYSGKEPRGWTKSLGRGKLTDSMPRPRTEVQRQDHLGLEPQGWSQPEKGPGLYGAVQV